MFEELENAKYEDLKELFETTKEFTEKDYENYMVQLKKINAKSKRIKNIVEQIEDEDILLIINILLIKMKTELDAYKSRKEGDNNE